LREPGTVEPIEQNGSRKSLPPRFAWSGRQHRPSQTPDWTQGHGVRRRPRRQMFSVFRGQISGFGIPSFRLPNSNPLFAFLRVLRGKNSGSSCRYLTGPGISVH